MRFLMMIFPSGYQHAASTAMPTAAQVERMMQFNEALTRAGVLLALDGLHPPVTATRLRFSGGKAQVIEQPSATEAIGGYWLLQVSSQQEAAAWASRCPAEDGDIIELRQVQDAADFPPEVLAKLSPEVVAVSEAAHARSREKE